MKNYQIGIQSTRDNLASYGHPLKEMQHFSLIFGAKVQYDNVVLSFMLFAILMILHPIVRFYQIPKHVCMINYLILLCMQVLLCISIPHINLIKSLLHNHLVNHVPHKLNLHYFARVPHNNINSLFLFLLMNINLSLHHAMSMVEIEVMLLEETNRSVSSVECLDIQLTGVIFDSMSISPILLLIRLLSP